MPNTIVPDIQQVVALLGSAAFLSGFALVTIQVVNVAFARVKRETTRPIDGEAVDGFELEGDVAERLRNLILFFIKGLSALFWVFVWVTMWVYLDPIVITSLEAWLSPQVFEAVAPPLKKLSLSPDVMKFVFVIFWLFMMYGVVRLLGARQELAQLV